MVKKANNQGSSTHIKHIEDNYKKHLEDMITRHSKVLQTRFDLRYPQGDMSHEEDRQHISIFIDNFNKDLKRNNPLPEKGMKRSPGSKPQVHAVDPIILWVRENHGKSDNTHYHCLTLVNGNAKRAGEDIQKRAERQWNNALKLKDVQGLVDFCYRGGPHSIMINRNSEDFEAKRTQAQKQASYLSKQKGKEHPDKGSWQAGGTRLPKNNEKISKA